MDTCGDVVAFESVAETLWCDRLNETSLAVHLHGTVCVSMFYEMKFRIFDSWELKVLKVVLLSTHTRTKKHPSLTRIITY